MKKLKRSLAAVAALALFLAISAGAAAYAAGEEPSSSGYIVQLKSPSAAESAPKLQPVSAKNGLYRCDDISVLRELDAEGAVEYIERDCSISLEELPNDSYYQKQWNLGAVHVEAAWDLGFRGSGVRIGIIDSGLNLAHEELAGVSIDGGYNMIDGSGNVSDYTGHGSFVAGIIAARSNNGKGIAGIADEVTLVPLKCFSRSEETNVSLVIEGIYKAVDDCGCDVINLSLGFSEDLRSFRNAIGYAEEHGVIVVSAVGNDGGTDLSYPAAYDNVIGVGSVGENGGISIFSQVNSSVFVTAPGEDIISIGSSGNDYVIGGGTSFAAPHVTALAALAKSVDPDIDTEGFKELLEKSASDRGVSGYDMTYGYGLIDFSAFADSLVVLQGQMEEPGNPAGADVFTDIQGHWAEECIRYCIEHNLFNGVSETSFEPDTAMSRAMLVTVLWRMAGSEETGGEDITVFSDVADDAWYASAVAWALHNGIITGFEDGSFRPNEPLSREQTAVILYRYEQGYGGGGFTGSWMYLLPFGDTQSIADWAYEAVAWCNMEGIMTGIGENLYDPEGLTTRSQVAAILQRYLQLSQPAAPQS